MGFSALYFASTALLSAQKPLWYDELLVFHTARLPGIGAIWSALLAGADLNPPAYPLLARASQAIVGETSFGTRLPAWLGFWVFALCLFRFVSVRCTAVYGWVALLFPMATSAYFQYAYEARSYSVVLGCCGLALVCWQIATEGHYRGVALIGLALSFVAAVSSHYLAVLIVFPFLLGETVRTVINRRIDLPMWIAFACGLFPLVLCLPLIRAAMEYRDTFWARASWSSIPRFYLRLLAGSVPPLIVGLVVWLSWNSVTGRDRLRKRETSIPFPRFDEITVAVGFIPILFGTAFGWSVGGHFHPFRPFRGRWHESSRILSGGTNPPL